VPIYAFGDRVPVVDPTAFVHPDAVLIGSVFVGPESTIWPGAVLRADDNEIRIGARTSIQDGAVLHCTRTLATVVGDDCTVGHLAHLEGCTVGNKALVGTGSIVMQEAVVGDGALVATNAVVTNRMAVPPGAIAMGVPAKIREGASDPEQNFRDAQNYVDRGKRFRAQMRRVDQ
jgi:carbonic anhydrase/acetyltransferase-like protein (isoleucine patch superfamily)